MVLAPVDVIPDHEIPGRQASYLQMVAIRMCWASRPLSLWHNVKVARQLPASADAPRQGFVLQKFAPQLGAMILGCLLFGFSDLTKLLVSKVLMILELKVQRFGGVWKSAQDKGPRSDRGAALLRKDGNPTLLRYSSLSGPLPAISRAWVTNRLEVWFLICAIIAWTPTVC